MTNTALTRPVILLHGWTMRGSVFGDLCARLGPAARAPDLPGHGDAKGGEGSLDAAIDMLEAEVASAGPQALVVGWSLGAAVAWGWLGRTGGTGD